MVEFYRLTIIVLMNKSRPSMQHNKADAEEEQ